MGLNGLLRPELNWGLNDFLDDRTGDDDLIAEPFPDPYLGVSVPLFNLPLKPN